MATTSRKDLPGTNAPNWSQRVTEELRVLMGRGGNGRALTAKDLIDSGIAKPGAGGGLVPGVPGSGDTEPDLTPPPTPTGFVAHGAISNLVMEHDPPTYPQGHGHGMTVVYGVIHSASDPLPTFDKAVELMRFAGVVASYASNPGTTWRLWIKWLSADGVLSVDPAGGINGLEVSTGQDVSQLLEVLNGKITQSQLYATLSREIDLISGTGAGSVTARVLAEAQARAQALVAESNARAQAIAAEAAARGRDLAAMAAELDAAANDLQARIDAVNAQVSDIIGASEFDPAQAYEAGHMVKYQNKLYRAKVNTVGNLPTNATYWDLVGDYASLGEAVAAHAAQLADHANRITQTEQGLTAEASAHTTLAAQLRGNYTGSDVAQVTSGLVWSERQARVAGDGANATAIDAVKARMPTGTGKVASEASVIDEATARAAADAAAASRTTAIEARLPAGTGALATAAAVTALDTRVTAAEGSLTSQSGQITSLKNSLSAAGGQNLFFNPSFEVASGTTGFADGWEASGNTGTARTPSLVTSWIEPGGKAQRLDCTGLSTTAYVDLRAQVSRRPSVVEGQRVALSAYVRGTPGLNVRMFLQAISAAGTSLITYNGVYADLTATGTRTELVSPVLPAGTVAIVALLRVHGATVASGYVEWDRVQLELGDTVTGWRDNGVASDEVTSSAVTALTSRVTAAEGVNTSQSTNITNLQNSVTILQTGKADASALSALDSKVTTQGNTLTSQGTAITALQNSITNGPVLPSDFSAGLGSWTLARQGDPSVVASAAGTIVSDDADFGVCAQFNNWTVAGQNVLTKGVVQAIPGRVYRVRARFKVVAAAGFPLGFNIVAGGNTAVYGAGGDAFSIAQNITTSGQIAEISALFSDKVANAAGAIAWGATAVLLRFGLRINGNTATGLQLRVQSITVEEATADVANADATTALTSRVTAAEGNISSTSSALTTLTNRVTAAEGVNTSQATAISGLNSSVTSINGTLTSQASQIGKLEASANGVNAPFASTITWDFASDAEGWTARGGNAVVTGGAFQFTTTTGTARITRSGISIKGSDYDKIRARIRRVSGTITLANLRLFYVNAAHGLSNSFIGSVATPEEFKTGAGWVEVEWDMANLAVGGTDWTDGTTTTIELEITNAGVASVVQVDWIAIGKRGAPASSEAVNAAVTTEATARANADTALASRATALESRMPTGTGQLATAAALTAVDTKVTNIDGRVTSESTRLDQVQAAVGSAAAVLQALNPLGGESEWTAVSGAATATFVTAAEADARGGAVLTVGNATVSGERWLRHVATIPMDESKLYKLTARFRRTAGDGGIYLGIAGLNAAKTLYVNTSNVETSAISSHHYATNNVKPALGTWQVVEYYFKGRSAGAATGSGTKAAPRVFANKVAHLALMIVGNYQGQVGFFDLDYITLEDVTAAELASAAIATEATARATTDGYLGAQYSVRMQLSQGGQQVVGGFGISGTTSGTAGPQIDFGVMANSFWIAAPSGSPGGVSNVKPFVVQTTAQTVNGVSVPAGVYMDAAYINNVTALWGRFGNLVADTIQATSISVTKLTGGNLAVGAVINSSNYVNGSTGWSINSNGWAEFSQVTVRGAIYSTAGTIGGITINGNGLNSGGFSGYQWPPAGQNGFHIGPNGILLGNANSGRYLQVEANGNIYAPGFSIVNGNANFSGNLSGASGSFSGVLTAQRVISMENLDYNIATVAVGVTAADLVGPVNGEVLGVTAPAADGNATYIVSFHADVGAGSAGALQIQVDGGTQFQFPMNTGGMKSFSFTFSGNGLTRRVRLYVAGNNTSPASTVTARSISVIVSKR